MQGHGSFRIVAGTLAIWFLGLGVVPVVPVHGQQGVAVNNGDHYVLTIEKHANGEFWATLLLPEPATLSLERSQTFAYQVDALPSHKVPYTSEATARLVGPAVMAVMPKWAPNSVSFSIQSGTRDEGSATSLRELMDGKRVVFSFRTAAGNQVITGFSLQGLGARITSQYGVAARADAGALERDREYKLAITIGTDSCKKLADTKQDPQLYGVCMRVLLQCAERTNKDKDTMAFLTCAAGR